MRPIHSWFLAAVVCLFPSIATAAITRISPQSIPLGSVEEFVTLFGTGLYGDESMVVTIDGPAGRFQVEPNNADDTVVIFWVPVQVSVVQGTYAVTLTSKNVNQQPRVMGPVSLVIEAPPLNGPPLLGLPEFVTHEADDSRSTVVEFATSAVSEDGTSLPVTCDHESGSLFPLGLTRVHCSATDSFGTTSGSFLVYVTDSVGPVLTLPEDITSEVNAVTFTATAHDAIDGALPVFCSPASGSTFPIGLTTVKCVATDSHANSTFGTFEVSVSVGGEGPVLNVPDDMRVNTSGPDGAVVTFDVTATNDGVVTCEPPSGSLFPIGSTSVVCTATNEFGADRETFQIIVADGVAPVLTVPDTIIVEATSPAGAVATFDVSATDAIEGTVPVICTASSGDTFPLGTTTVQCTAVDLEGNEATDSFDIIVRDTVKPVVTVPGTITREATSFLGAVVTFTVSATDNIDGARPVTCDHPSGSTFALGTTLVTCSASDLSGNTASKGFDVVVVDTTPPSLSLPSTITAEATSGAGAVVTYTVTATDIADPAPIVSCTPASGATFPLGTTHVQCTADDHSGNHAAGSFDVIVRDTIAPHVTATVVTPAVLWPPSHKLEPVSISVDAVDAVDAAPTSRIVSVSSSQPANGNGDGNTSSDWVITGPLTLQLRSERSGNSDRVYTITVETSDFSGNVTVTTATVTVQQGSSRRRAVR